ncbi:protein of unknown function [Pseudomonas mediterranea]
MSLLLAVALLIYLTCDPTRPRSIVTEAGILLLGGKADAPI